MGYRPPFKVTTRVIRMIADIERMLGQIDISSLVRQEPQLRRQNRVRSIADSLAIEGNSLSLEQTTAIFDNKRVIGPKAEILEIQNAIKAYAKASAWKAHVEKDFKSAHAILMTGLLPTAGKYRPGAVGIIKGSKVSHVAPGAKQLPILMANLFRFAAKIRDTHPLILGAVVHYEIEFIHPFEDGNGRIGRLWQHVILRNYHPFFAHVPFESFIRQRQKDYYATLEKCDKTGDCTLFVEFSLQTLIAALKEQISFIPRRRSTSDERLRTARETLAKRWFNRKDYSALFPDISLPTASRDLVGAVTHKLMRKKGEKNQTKYQFSI